MKKDIVRKKALRFEDLEVWQKAHQFVLHVYRVTKDFPAEERYGLVSQMRRAAISIPANIAEGFKKRSLKEKIHFYNIAQSSLAEIHYYVILSKDLTYLIDNQELLERVEEIGKMLHRLILSIQER